MFCTRAEQAKVKLEALHQAYADKVSETHNLWKIVERLPELCGDYKKRTSTLKQSLQDAQVEDVNVESQKPSKLQRELSRLSTLEVTLRSEMQVLKEGSLSYGDLEDDQSATCHFQRSMEEFNV